MRILVFQDIINRNDAALPKFNVPYIIADINNANGSDLGLIENIFKRGFDNNMLSYSGYNTSANAIGSALAMGLTAYIAKNEKQFNQEAFKKLLAIRFLDDWAYQAAERQNYPKIDMAEYERTVKRFLNFDFEAKYCYPWNRSFEIGVKIL